MTSLDSVVDKKIRPMLEDAMRQYLGVRVEELGTDISDRLRRPLFDIPADASMPFKKAKLLFKKYYLTRLLQLNFGNVQQAARIGGVDRRSVHRLVRELGMRPDDARKELHRQSFYVRGEVQAIVQEKTERYKGAIAPQRYKQFYEHAPRLSDQIAKELPLEMPTMKQAEREWEKRYLQQALERFGPSPVAVARSIGLRYETLHRKLASHGL